MQWRVIATNLLDFKVLLLLVLIMRNYVPSYIRHIRQELERSGARVRLRFVENGGAYADGIIVSLFLLHMSALQNYAMRDAYVDQRLRGGIPASASALNLPLTFFLPSLFVLLRLLSFRTRKPLPERMIADSSPQSKGNEHLVRFGSV